MVSKTSGKQSARSDRQETTAKGGERNVGEALRAVYHDAVSETVPDEMLELLKKLG